MDQQRWANIQGMAALAAGWIEMGQWSDADVETSVRAHMDRLGVSTRADALLIAEEIRRLPQPLDLPAEEREQRRPVEDMLGVTPSETQLEAQLRAREMLLRIAETL